MKRPPEPASIFPILLMMYQPRFPHRRPTHARGDTVATALFPGIYSEEATSL